MPVALFLGFAAALLGLGVSAPVAGVLLALSAALVAASRPAAPRLRPFGATGDGRAR